MMTLEGVIAAVLILSVAYFLFQSTMIISPVSDEVVYVQMRQYGQDALTIINSQTGAEDTLQYALKRINSTYTPYELLNSLEKLLPDYTDFNLQVYYVNMTTNEIEVYNITNRIPTSTTVTASTYLVIRNGEFVDDSPFKLNSTGIEGSNANVPILLEVRLTLWRV
jgi:hypothetical protein